VSALASILTLLAYLGMISFVLWLFAIRGRLPTKDKVSRLLRCVAVYTLMLGLLSNAGVFKAFDGLRGELTSPVPAPDGV
jgi:hypothetical protein